MQTIDTALIAPMWTDEWNKLETGSRELLSIQYIASYLESKDINCLLLNGYAYEMDNQTIIDKILALKNCKIVGITCVGQRTYPNVKKMIEQIKRNTDFKVCLGGQFPSVCHDTIFNDIPELDFIIKGEGERAFYQLVSAIHSDTDYSKIPGLCFRDNADSKKIINTGAPERIKDLLEIPWARRDINVINMLPPAERSFRLFAGRGCYGRCAFCCGRAVHNNNYFKLYRSPDNVVNEISTLYEKYAISKYWFCDDIFYELSPKGKKWVNDFSDELEKKKIDITFGIMLRINDVEEESLLRLRSLGMNRLFLGVESGIPRLLTELGKNYSPELVIEKLQILKKLNITIVLGWIAIIPTMSFTELEENYKFLIKTNLYTAKNLYNRLNVYAGCPYEQLLKDKKLIKEKANFWDINEYYFEDQKVELFYKLLIKERKPLSAIDKLVKEKRDLLQIKDNGKLYDSILRQIDDIWKDLILLIIQEIKSGNVQAENSETVSQFVKDIVEKTSKEIRSYI